MGRDYNFFDKREEQETLSFYDYMNTAKGNADFTAALNHIINFQKKISVEELSDRVGYKPKTIIEIMDGAGERFKTKRHKIATECGYQLSNFYRLGNKITSGAFDPLTNNIPTIENDPESPTHLQKKDILERFKNSSLAKDIFDKLLQLEGINQSAFARVVGVIDKELQIQKDVAERK